VRVKGDRDRMPHPHIARADASILVVVDVQEPFAKAMADRQSVAKNIATLIHVARIVEAPVIVTEQNREKLGPTVAELSSVLGELKAYQPIDKMAFSCCASEQFIKQVYDSGRDTLVLTGMEAHVCVQQTALDALNLGYKVHIVSDAVTSRRREDWTIAIEKLRHAGAVISSMEMVAYEWLERGDTPQFKAAMQHLRW